MNFVILEWKLLISFILSLAILSVPLIHEYPVAQVTFCILYTQEYFIFETIQLEMTITNQDFFFSDM